MKNFTTTNVLDLINKSSVSKVVDINDQLNDLTEQLNAAWLKKEEILKMNPVTTKSWKIFYNVFLWTIYKKDFISDETEKFVANMKINYKVPAHIEITKADNFKIKHSYKLSSLPMILEDIQAKRELEDYVK